jgi:MoaA/NifB/PqqE/SkfB family radical SAM enzyme
MNIPVVGFHIEPTNICTLKCPGCARTRFLNQWPQHWKNHSLEISTLIDFLDIDLQGKNITLCGNYGDPIYHAQLIEMVDEFKKRKAHVSIVTNGSYRQAQWWQRLCDVLESTDIITFSIDGLPSNFHEYRVNADWESIKKGIEICVSNNMHTIWKFIPFRFNQNDIDQAKRLAGNLGIKNFVIDPSDRFDQETNVFLPDIKWVGPRKTAQDDFRKDISNEIDPKCYKGKEYFITADGYFSPCCFVADHRFFYKTQFGKNKNKYDIRSTTFTKLLADAQVMDFYDKIQIDQLQVCKYNCPKS